MSTLNASRLFVSDVFIDYIYRGLISKPTSMTRVEPKDVQVDGYGDTVRYGESDS